MSLFQDFEAFYREHVGRVRSVLFRFCGRAPLEDLTQEVFLRAWKSKDTHMDRALPSTWIYKVATNVAIDHLRKNKQHLIALEESLIENASSPSSLSKEEAYSLKEVLSQMDVEHGSVLVLHYFEDLEIEEIAKILQIPEGTVKSRLFHARKKMEEALAGGKNHEKQRSS